MNRVERQAVLASYEKHLHGEYREKLLSYLRDLRSNGSRTGGSVSERMPRIIDVLNTLKRMASKYRKDANESIKRNSHMNHATGTPIPQEETP